MGYETKVILSLAAKSIRKAKTVKEAYEIIVDAVNVEQLILPPFEDETEDEK